MTEYEYHCEGWVNHPLNAIEGQLVVEANQVAWLVSNVGNFERGVIWLLVMYLWDVNAYGAFNVPDYLSQR